MACENFLLLNDVALVASDLDLYPRYLALAGGTMPEADFATWLRQHMEIETPPDAVQEAEADHVAR